MWETDCIRSGKRDGKEQRRFDETWRKRREGREGRRGRRMSSEERRGVAPSVERKIGEIFVLMEYRFGVVLEYRRGVVFCDIGEGVHVRPKRTCFAWIIFRAKRRVH